MNSHPPTKRAEEWSADVLIPFGKYVLLNRISSGSTASVYRAKVRGEAGFERLVAIKRILPHMSGDPEFVTTFVREAKTVARLNHAAICPVYELGRVGESLYMALEYVAGKDLGRVVKALRKRGRAMPPILAAYIASRLCDALDYAHSLRNAKGESAGLIHRDLSPANALISYDGQVKLIDFGLAKATGRAQQTNVDALKKKLGYMSPEMVKGKPVDARSDIFGVGVLLYEMLTERRLFAGSDDMATLRLLGSASVPPPSAFTEDVPEALEMAVMRALHLEPELRYQSAGEMGEELMAFVRSENPMYGPRQVKAFMEDLFQEERDSEQAEVTRLLSASNDPQFLVERQRFFSSPTGAAAVARAEVAERLSRRGSTLPPVVDKDAVRVPKAPPLPREAAPSEPPEEATHIFSEEPTRAFRGAGAPDVHPPPPRGGTGAATQPPAAPVVTSPFEEEATEIFFNKEDGVGLSDLLAEVEPDRPSVDDFRDVATSMAEPRSVLPASAPLSARARPRTPTPVPGPTVARPPAPMAPPPRRRVRATTLFDASRARVARNERVANWMLIGGVFLLSLSLVGLLLRTPLGEKLGLRNGSYGAIEVRTTPSAPAAVKLDGVFRGQAPLRMDRVPKGSRRVEVEAPGYPKVTYDVMLRAGSTAVIEVPLK